MMETKKISETLVFNSTLTRLIAREDFTAYEYSVAKHTSIVPHQFLQHGRRMYIFCMLCNNIWTCHLLLASYFPGLLFDPEDGNGTFLRNVGKLLPDHTSQKKALCVIRLACVDKKEIVVPVLN
jgi:hypothetical protein